MKYSYSPAPAPGCHRHQCYNCRSVWEHSDGLTNDVAAHTCPSCNAEPAQMSDGIAGFVAYLDDPRRKNWAKYAGDDTPVVNFCDAGPRAA